VEAEREGREREEGKVSGPRPRFSTSPFCPGSGFAGGGREGERKDAGRRHLPSCLRVSDGCYRFPADTRSQEEVKSLGEDRKRKGRKERGSSTDMRLVSASVFQSRHPDNLEGRGEGVPGRGGEGREKKQKKKKREKEEGGRLSGG